jgi:hypothetical protein
MSISGSCFCGSVSYAVSAPLENARSCHCSRCRKVFGGAASAYAEVQSGSFEWVAGRENVKFYAAGPDWGLAFCDNCGSALAGILQDEVHGITLGTVDGDPGVELAMHIYVESKAPWDHIGGDAPQFTEGPDDVGT